MSGTITDRFGRVFTITENGGERTYTAQDGSISVGLSVDRAPDAVLETLEAMAPPRAPAPPAPPAIPESITSFQFRAALFNLPGAGPGRTMLDDVSAWLEAQGGLAWQAWEYGAAFERDGALIPSIGAQFGLSDAALDAIFLNANQTVATFTGDGPWQF